MNDKMQGRYFALCRLERPWHAYAIKCRKKKEIVFHKNSSVTYREKIQD